MDSNYIRKEGRVLLGEDERLPDVIPLETKNRGIWAEKRGVRTGRTSFLNKKVKSRS